ncbi:hypothetical protein DSO57_1000810 [Entomophthora muscae]|uniref:Uncharacterized protein n=1 Tax=Entomophthora muscae TaxID=34485 RepID=A0ACC2U720_9FUNG|nr:hypothetical protein DSO57_1000810 [Entomophthora muscae]
MIHLTDKSGVTNGTQLKNSPLTTNKKLPQLLAASNQPPPAFTPSPRVLDQELIPAYAPCPSFPGVPLLQQLAHPNLTMSATTGELPLVPSASSYDYSKLGFSYLTMLALTEQVIPHMGVWRPWATAANYVMWMTPIIYWAFQAQPFLLTKGSPGSHPGHDSGVGNFDQAMMPIMMEPTDWDCYNQIHKLVVQNTMIQIMAELVDMNCSYQTT